MWQQCAYASDCRMRALQYTSHIAGQNPYTRHTAIKLNGSNKRDIRICNRPADQRITIWEQSYLQKDPNHSPEKLGLAQS
jgi:hypothetical protein